MPCAAGEKGRSARVSDLGFMAYQTALSCQLKAAEAKMSDRRMPDILYLVEHPRVFTLGKRGGRENLVVSERFLAEQGIEVIQTDRGGNITYHGPGQAVLYPVVDLEKNKIAVKEFVYSLEEVMKQTARQFGVTADRDPRNHGLWVQNAKIGSVGISIKKGISCHGLALNALNDLTPFSWINPCGMSNVSMTSLARENPGIKASVSMEDIKHALVDHFARVLGFDMKFNVPGEGKP